ncbi:hypothetical protein FNF31_06443 [Cafeteria roenbergensis]|uniref:Uncharacterized protein n=1 Tax=Cafeteria roenbergensis TaxID=33653 RepID=A0A5A8CL89_CAFRO|nr:hypothetical protein FNF31_06443 [Cafeteria roenbergensis]
MPTVVFGRGQLSLDLIESWVDCSDGAERRAVLSKLTPGSDDHIKLLSALAEQEGFPADLMSMADELKSSLSKRHTHSSALQLLERLQKRRTLAQAGAGSAEADKEFHDILHRELAVSSAHSRRAVGRRVVDERAHGPSSLPESARAKLSLKSLLEEARSSVGTVSDPTRNAMWVSRLERSAAPLEIEEVRRFLDSSVPDKLALRQAVLEMGLPLTADRMELVEAILVALPEDRHVPFDETTIAGGLVKGVLSMIGRERPLVSSKASTYYTQLSLAELLALRKRGKVQSIHNDNEWVKAVLSRHGPSEGVMLDDSNPGAVDAYLDSVQGFVDTLPAIYTDLRMWVHGQRCRFARDRTGKVLSAKDDAIALLDLPFGWRGRSTTDAMRKADNISSLRHELVRSHSQPIAAGFPLLLPELDRETFDSLLDSAIQEMAASDDEDGFKRLTKYVDTEYAASLRATAKLLSGDTSHEWTSVLGEGRTQRLRDTSELDFVQTREFFAVDEPAVVHLQVKGVDSLKISLFELNTTAIYRETGAELRTDMELQGLVPAVVEDRAFDRSPFQRTVETIALPALAETRRGVWVLEVVGGGKCARCIIRKGALRVVSAITAAGHSFRVLDELNRPVPADRVSIWMNGSEFRSEAVEHPASFADEAARNSDAGSQIVIPFTGATPATKTIVVTLNPEAEDAAAASSAGAPADWSFSSLHSFTHERESFELDCGWALDRQAIVRDNRNATLLIRPRLYLSGSTGRMAPSPLERLEDVTLTVVSTDVEGTEATRVWRDIALSSGEEHAVSFAVPNRLRSLSFRLQCSIEVAHTGAKQKLSQSHSVAVNRIETSPSTADVFLRQAVDGYRIYVLGKTGEPVQNAPLSVTVANTFTSRTFTQEMATGEDGCVALGVLPNVASISVRSRDAAVFSASFSIGPERSNTVPTSAWAVEGEAEQVVFPHALAAGETGVGRARLFRVAEAPRRAQPSPLGGAPGLAGFVIRDDVTAECLRFDASQAALVASGLTAGRYALLTRSSEPLATGDLQSLAITVAPAAGAVSAAAAAAAAAAGVADEGSASLQLLADAGRFVALPRVSPTRIVSVDVSDEGLTIRTAGGVRPDSKSAGGRVHVFVGHFGYDGQLDAFGQDLGAVGLDALERSFETSAPRAKSAYLRPARLGEEHAYVLARQGATVFPGNSLPRPSLLNTPWAQRTTTSDEQTARDGESFESRNIADVQASGSRRSKRAMAGASMRRGRRAGGGGGGGSAPSTADGETCFDMLSGPAVTLSNLRPGPDGLISLPMDSLFAGEGDVCANLRASGASVLVVFADGFTCATASAVVPGDAGEPLNTSGSAPLRRCYRDLTLQEPLDTTKHFVQTKAVVTLQPGEDATLTAASDTQAEEYGTVDKALRLMATLSGDGRVLGEFSWLGRWHATDEPERRRLYSKYACHEVNLFLYFKDRAWFDAVVAPFVACKRSKTFIDHFVLGHDLAPFAAPGRYALLNALERALLAGRAAGAAGGDAFSRDRALRRKLSPARMEAVFNAAISSNSLEDTGEDRVKAASKAAEMPRPVPSAPAFAAQMAAAPSMARRGAAMPMARSRRSGKAVEADFAAAPARSFACAAAEPMDAYAEVDDCIGAAMGDMAIASAYDYDEQETVELAAVSRRRRQMFRAVDKTEELAETHYWRVRAGQGREKGLVTDSPFWADFAAHQARADGSAFVSSHFAEATGNINEVLAAVAVLALPFAMPSPSSVVAGRGKLVYGATASPLVLFKVDISEAEAPAAARVLVGQNFFDPQDRSRTEADGSVTEKYLETGEFLRNKVYGAQVVVTNVSSSSRDLRVLLQIPQGALPTEAGFVTRTRDIRLSAYQTRTLEFRFYFPFLGAFSMFPAHVSAGEALEAHAAPAELRVVTALTVVDKTSWEYIANESPLEECIAYLSTSNLQVNGVTLSDVAWRCAEVPAYKAITAALRARCEWDAAVFGYAFKHKDLQGMAEYAMHTDGGFSRISGLLEPRFSSPLLAMASEIGVGATGNSVAALTSSEPGGSVLGDSDMAASGLYEHLEYAPLVNARAHRLGEERRIANQAVAAQYRRLLATLMHAPADSVTAAERLALVYHLLLQDRVEEAQRHFALVQAPAGCAAVGGSGDGSGAAAAAAAGAGGSAPSAGSASWCALAYDYMAAYIDFFAPEGGLAVARRVAEAYAAYPVPRWAAKFAAVRSQLAELDLAEEEAASGSGSRAGKAGQSSSKGGTAPGERDEDLGSELLREAQQAGAAGGEPTLDMELTKGAGSDASLRIVAANVQSVELRYYCMDVELLFSTKPFTSAGAGNSGSSSGGFAFVRPNKSVTVDVRAAGGASMREEVVPVDTSVGSNLLIEAVAGGKRAAVTFFAASLDVELMESAGRVRVTRSSDGRPIARAYVKVFGSCTDGGSDSDAFFFKDCYTSATGVADYASVSTDALDRVRKFAVLVATPEHGAVVRTARKPAS